MAEAMRHVIIAATIAVIGLSSPTVFAQSADPETLTDEQKSEFGRLLNAAKDAFEAERYREAVEALELAYAILPEPNIHYRIGEAYELLGELEPAITAYQRYLDEAPDVRDRSLIERRIEDLERRLGALRAELDATPAEAADAVFLLDTNPSGAAVLIDGESSGRPTPVRVTVEPGRHVVELRLPNHQSLRREVEIAAGETISLVYQLEQTATPETSGRGPMPWVVTSIGAAGLLAGGGLLVASTAAAKRVDRWDAEREAAYASGSDVPERPVGYNEAKRNRVVFRNAALISGGVGALALIGGITWLAVGGEPRDAGVSFTGTSLQFQARF